MMGTVTVPNGKTGERETYASMGRPVPMDEGEPRCYCLL